MKNIFQIKILIIALVFTINLGLISAAANFQVISFSCSPSESIINDVFSCAAQVKNTGDSAGSVSTATLYPDENDWLENSNYPQASGTSVDPDQSTSITFSGLRATKSGNNGFSKIMLDSVTDTYVADNNKKVNVINVAVTVNNSVSSAAMNEEITMTSEVTAGGNVDVLLTFAVSSGGCSIGSQTNPKSITGMIDGSKQSRTWTITQGTSGSCQYTMSVSATGEGGVASKIDSTSSTITCSNCPVASSSTTGGGSSGGGGGGGGITNIGELIGTQTKKFLNNQRINFNISSVTYGITLKNLTAVNALVSFSTGINKELALKEETKVDLNGDGQSDISVKLESINILTLQADLIMTRLAPLNVPAENEEANQAISGKATAGDGGELSKLGTNIWIYLIIGIVIILVLIIIIYFINKRRNPYTLR